MNAAATAILVWLGLLALLAATVLASFTLSDGASLAASGSIALAKAGLILWFYMHLKERSGLVRLFAIGAAVWLSILITLSLSDFATRAW